MSPGRKHLWLGTLALATLLILPNYLGSLQLGRSSRIKPQYNLHALDLTPAHGGLAGAAEESMQAADLGCQAAENGPLFTVFILNPNDILREIPRLAAPNFKCNLSSELVWPLVQPGRGSEGEFTTPHWDYQHATQLWITQAVRNSSLVRLVDSADEADLVYVDMHCFSMWTYSFIHPLGEHNQWDPTAAFHSKAYPVDKLCGELREALWMVPERESMCPAVQDGAPSGRFVIIPYSTVSDLEFAPIRRTKKHYFMFYSGQCSHFELRRNRAAALNYSSGKLMRLWAVQAIHGLPKKLRGPGNTTAVSCNKGKLHNETMQIIQNTLFCLVIPGDTQSSRRVSEVILGGCIPVFLGPPFHTLPLADEVDYKAFSVFFNFTKTSQWIVPGRWTGTPANDERVLDRWKPDLDLQGAVQSVRNMGQAFKYLRSIPGEQLDRMHAAMERERLKLLYIDTGGGKAQLGGLLVKKMCQRALKVRQSRHEAGTIPGSPSPGGSRQNSR